MCDGSPLHVRVTYTLYENLSYLAFFKARHPIPHIADTTNNHIIRLLSPVLGTSSYAPEGAEVVGAVVCVEFCACSVLVVLAAGALPLVL